MKIALDARGINWYKGTGIGTYTYNLLKNLFIIDEINNYDLFWSGDFFMEFKTNKSNIVMASKRHQRFFENHYFPNYINSNKINLYHIPQNGMGLCEDINALKVVTIHDLIPYVLPETVGSGYLRSFLENMPRIIDSCDGILTVSEFSKNDILRFFPNFPKERIFVTPLAANSNFKPLDKELCLSSVQSRFNFSKPYILYIGGFSSRKNVAGLINAFAKIQKNIPKEYILLIVGALKDEGLRMKSLVSDLKLNENVIFTDFIEDEYLPVLYNAADVFVYPSIYEGFGLPPLEAMNCNTPVISSNISSIPEVIGDSGILINPFDIQELSNALEKILADSKYRESITALGHNRSKLFDWKKTAQNTLVAYDTILNLKSKDLLRTSTL
ncbi:Glycosyltransferase involved in cell wall bisynthesis [Clostridium cavendishii DSM 21758]|uniref:Glycosyltransferase involved in cell wall bisynthesis n=1 Tax=Clostridium cavendishii DSM 21758 TaxID=1121302 RepID=A0A1M6U7L2_9CLOT|nr:glycosyltransferase family 1 protein [Clostridium cavendishii]SHK65161.1 Glycosyltransferase involved in cell wall bisynthesis [Clostridium cavendishii DSM 21758]